METVAKNGKYYGTGGKRVTGDFSGVIDTSGPVVVSGNMTGYIKNTGGGFVGGDLIGIFDTTGDVVVVGDVKGKVVGGSVKPIEEAANGLADRLEAEAKKLQEQAQQIRCNPKSVAEMIEQEIIAQENELHRRYRAVSQDERLEFSGPGARRRKTSTNRTRLTGYQTDDDGSGYLYAGFVFEGLAENPTLGSSGSGSRSSGSNSSSSSSGSGSRSSGSDSSSSSSGSGSGGSDSGGCD